MTIPPSRPFEGCERNPSALHRGWKPWIHLLVISYVLCGYLMSRHGSPIVTIATMIMFSAWLITGITVVTRLMLRRLHSVRLVLDRSQLQGVVPDPVLHPLTGSLAVVTGAIRVVGDLQMAPSGRLSA